MAALVLLAICIANGLNLITSAEAMNKLDLTRRTFNILLTGFEPFLNFSHNPTEDISRALKDVCEDVTILPELNGTWSSTMVSLHICWHAHALPVNRTGALWTVQHLQSLSAREVPYDAVFHLGFESSAKGLKLEVAAANILANDTGADGHERAVQDGEPLLPTTVNTGWLNVDAIDAGAPSGSLAGEAELWSRDAGKYFCNEVYYRTLHFIRGQKLLTSSGALLPAMFIHMPNQNVSTIHGDTDVVRQVVGHALWGTYLAAIDTSVTQLYEPFQNFKAKDPHIHTLWNLLLIVVVSVSFGVLIGFYVASLWTGRYKSTSLTEVLVSS